MPVVVENCMFHRPHLPLTDSLRLKRKARRCPTPLLLLGGIRKVLAFPMPALLSQVSKHG